MYIWFESHVYVYREKGTNYELTKKFKKFLNNIIAVRMVTNTPNV